MKNAKRFAGMIAKVSKYTLLTGLSTGLLLVAAEDKKAEPAGKTDAAASTSSKEDDAKYEVRVREIQERAMKAMYAEFEKGGRELQKEFPKRPENYELLLEVANKADDAKAQKLAQEIVDSGVASDEVKEAAKGLLKKLGAIGKPVDIKFTALNGQEVDLSKLKGKVILIDFWATWCGPCVKEIPNVKAAYDKLHSKGFEIVGISFDQKKDALEKFVKEKEMPWAQYFDGQGWANKYGKEFGINSIPTMWLVDKNGNLRDTDGRSGLEEKVEKLLAEK